MFRLEKVRYKHILNIEKLEIPERKVVCVFGESGAGKTTLLRLLNHLISSDSGQIFMYNEDITQLDPIQLRRRVVMLPQTPIVFASSIKANLLAAIEFSQKTVPTDEVMQDVLSFVKLAKDLTTQAQKLSGGEKQRMALARVLLLEPDVLLLDEPSAALDEETENIVISKIVEYVKQKNRSLVMVTHSKKVVSDYADYTIELEQGRVKRAGVTACLLEA